MKQTRERSWGTSGKLFLKIGGHIYWFMLDIGRICITVERKYQDES